MKIYLREAGRLERSLQAGRDSGAETIIGVLHYPPTNDMHQPSLFTQLMERYGVKTCVYGHLHKQENFKRGIKGVLNGVEYRLVSYDYVEGRPVRII
jgi:predicted phosphohydrolase